MKVDYQQWVDAINKGTKWASDYFYCLACATRWEWTAQNSRILFYLLVLAPLFLSAIPITSSTIFILHTYARKPSSIICQTFWHISSPSSETIFNHYSFMWISLSHSLFVDTSLKWILLIPVIAATTTSNIGSDGSLNFKQHSPFFISPSMHWIFIKCCCLPFNCQSKMSKNSS